MHQSDGRHIEIVCHRGANEYAPGNTYAAARLCVEWGMDYVEIDVNTSRDGVLYIYHGPELYYTTGRDGMFGDLTAEEIDRLDVGSWFGPQFAGERVPRLEPFLRWIKGKARVYFDVKRAGHEQLVRLVYDTGLAGECFFWSWSDEWMLRLHELDPKLAIMVSVCSPEDVAAAVERFGARIVEIDLANMGAPLVAECRAQGLKVMINYMGRDPECWRQVLAWSPDMLNTDHGDRFAAFVAQSRAE